MQVLKAGTLFLLQQPGLPWKAYTVGGASVLLSTFPGKGKSRHILPGFVLVSRLDTLSPTWLRGCARKEGQAALARGGWRTDL